MERFSMFTMENGKAVYLDTTRVFAVKDIRAKKQGFY